MRWQKFTHENLKVVFKIIGQQLLAIKKLKYMHIKIKDILKISCTKCNEKNKYCM